MIQRCNALMENPPKPASNPSSLHEAFWLSNHIFKEVSKKGTNTADGMNMSSKRIFLFTTRDIPPIPDKSSQEVEIAQAETHAKQLEDADIDLELFPIRIKGQIFDYSKFYQSIIKVDAEEAAEYLLGQSDKLSDLAARVRRREFKKKRLGRVDFRISEGVIVGTQL